MGVVRTVIKEGDLKNYPKKGDTVRCLFATWHDIPILLILAFLRRAFARRDQVVMHVRSYVVLTFADQGLLSVVHRHGKKNTTRLKRQSP